MKAALPVIARVLLGLVLVFSGVVGLFELYPMPTDLPENLKTFNAGMKAARYFFPLLKATELVCGLFLLSGFFVSLALVILAPVILNIFLVHSFIAPEGIPLALIMGLIMIYLSFFSKYSPPIKALFRK